MPALPYLIIVVDEFADFKTKFPDFMKPIERIFALGRALGVFVVIVLMIVKKFSSNTEG